MKNSRRLLIVTLGLCFSLSALTARADFQDRLIAKYPSAVGAKIEKSFTGFWSVSKNGEVFFFNDDLTIMINGDVIDLKNQESLTAKLKEASQQKIDVSLLPIKDAIKLGSGSRRIYVFSDPDCPYCKRLEGELNQLQDTEIYIFPMPLISLHPNSGVVSESIWCQSNRENAWRGYMDNGLIPATTTCDNPISRNLALAESIRIQGTPAIIFADGTLIPGAVPVNAINDKLKALSSK